MTLSTVEAFKHIKDNELTIPLEGERLHALQRVLRMMLSDIESVCSAEKIEFTLSGGTCLGAIRHKGFIPWDDDVDINMTRSGFNRFCQVFEEILGEKYWLHEPGETEGYELGLARVRLKNTVVRSREDYGSDEMGAYVDIFILEDVPNNRIVRAVHGFISMCLGFALSCRRFFDHREDYFALAGTDPAVLSTFRKKAVLGKVFSFASSARWLKMWDKWNSLCKNDTSKYLSIPVGRKHYFGELYRRDDFFPIQTGIFEGLNVPLPAHPEIYMTALYGPDYMVMPPVEKREKHVVYEFDLGEYSSLSCSDGAE